MVTFSEYTKNKKKKKTSFREHTESVLGITLDDDIAPVRESGSGTVTESTVLTNQTKQKNSYLQKGALSEGFSLKNIDKTRKATEADIAEDATKGILGLAERVWDGFVQYSVHNAYATAESANIFHDPTLTKANAEIYEESKKQAAEYVAKDLIKEDEIARKIITEPWQKSTGIDVETSSFLGSKGDELVQSASDMLVRQGLNYFVPGSGLALTGLSSFGGEAENAYNNGATYEQAFLSGMISAGAEVGTEKIAGIKFGGKTLTDGMAKGIAKAVPNKVLSTLAKWGFNTVGEGAEEVIAGNMTAIGQKLTYQSDKELDELFTNEDKWESFVAGAILGGIFEGSSVVSSNLNGTDYVTGLDKNEKQVIDAVYNELLEEQQTDGKKLTQSEKNKLYNSVEKAIEKGYIDVETIEKTLGGEAYKAYKDATDIEDALKKEYEELGNTSNPTLAQTARYNELTQKVKDLETNSNKGQLKEQMSREVFEKVKNTRLIESYNEQERIKQSFEADLNSYTNENAKQTVKNFMEQTKFNNSNRTHDFVDMLTKVSEDRGHVFEFMTTAQLEESIRNGNQYGIDVDPKNIEAFIHKKSNRIVINMDANKSLRSLVGHEVSHTFEKANGYDKMQEVLFKYAKMKGEYADRLASVERRYGKDDVYYELTADLLGDYIMGDTDFISSLSTENPGILKRIYNEIKYLYKMATAGSAEARQFEKVKREIERAWRESASPEGDTQFSIRKEAPPKETGVAYKVFYVKDGKLYPPMVANPDGADTPIGVWLNADVGTAAPPSKTGRAQVKAGGKGTQGGSGSLAFRPGWHLGDLPRASQFDRTNPETGEKNLFPKDFVWAEVEYAKDVDYQEEAMSYGYTDNGKFRHAYAGLPRLPENGYYRYRTNPKPDTVPWVITGAMKVNRLLSDAEVNEILEKNGVPAVHRQGGDVELDKFGFNKDGSIKYSISDSDGNQLTKEQQEFFKNSKARDDEGNLMVVYHGSTDYGFTVFDTSKTKDGTSLFFTNDATMANTYVNDRSKLYKTYLNLENPYIVDAKGHKWNQIRLGDNTDDITGKVERFVDLAMRYDVEIDFSLVGENLGNMYDSVEYMLQDEMENLDDGETSLYTDAEKDELRRLASEIDDAYENWDEEAHLDEDGEPTNLRQYLLEHKLSTSYTTREIAKIAKEQGNDGVIIKNVYDNGKFVSDTGIHGFGNVYIAFNPNQVKTVDNTKPTSDADIRFSLKDPVEETKELIAVHNLTADKLSKSLRLGGLPMPSIAIAKAKDGHNDFGEISLILDKESIDPQTSRRNKVYSGDAWTPTYPRVEYKANDKVRTEIADKIRNLVPYEVQDALDNIMLDSENVRDMLNRNGGNMVEAFSRSDSMKYAYLRDIGADITLPMKEANLYRYGEASNEAVRYFAGKLVNGLQTVEHYNNMSSRDLMQDKALCEAVTDAQNFDVLRTLEPNSDEYLEYERNPVFRADDVALRDILGFLEASRKLLKNGISQTVDRKTARELIDSKVNKSDYEVWLKELFDGIVEKEGIRNNQDLFTRSGNRRSFEALHYEHNLENVIKAMSEKGEKGIGAFGGGNIFGASATEFASIDELKKGSKRLQNLTDEEYQAIKEGFSTRFFELASSLPNHKDSFSARDDAANTMIEAISKYKTRNGIANYLKRELQGWATYSETAVDELIELVNDIRNMPTGYFEAKPQRAVGFDEVGVFVIPNNVDAKLKQELLSKGYSIAEYDPNVEGDRKRVVNQFEQYMFRIADDAQYTSKSNEAFPIYAKDLRLAEETQTESEIAPTTQIADDYGPLTETEAITRDDKQIEEHYFLDDVAPEVEEQYNGEFADHVKPADPFYEKDIWEVGKDRSQKAYMYENPEVKPFFQEEARYMLGELDNSQKGERFYNDQLYYDTNGEMGYFGTKRHTSDDIAYLLDTFNYTYKDIAKGLNAIIEDNGKENNAISKRIEFLLDERLRLGYTDFWFGDKVPPNQEYINLLNEKQVTEYSDESWNEWLRNLSEDDIKQYFTASERVEEVAPTKEYAPAEGENITAESTTQEAPLYDARPGRGVIEGQQSMFEEMDSETKKINKIIARERAKITEEYEQKKAEIQSIVRNKDTYISQEAAKLYDELSNLRKGVKASKKLGYLLDHGYDWNEVKSALLSIEYHPGGRVDENSIPESLAREMFDKEYENNLYALDDLETEYGKQVKELEEKANVMRAEAQKTNQANDRKTLHSNIIEGFKNVFASKSYNFDDVLKNAKDLSTFATVDNTPQRVMEKALGYKEGQILSDLTVNKVAQNETEGIKWLNSITDRKGGLLAQLSKQYNIKPGSKKSSAAQMYAEGFYVNENNEIITYGDAELAKDFPNPKVQADIKGLANDPRIRKFYDDTLAKINESRIRNAYPEIPRLDNYFLHFRAMEDTFSKLGLPFNPNDIRAKDLPTDLNGVTADLKPGQPYFASAMHRSGKRTSFDLLGGLERYAISAKNQIYHIDDIQNLRALRNYVADTYGQANGLENLDGLSEEEVQNRIEQVYNSHLSTFAKFLNEEANILAGKTALIDRGLEGIIGRRGITFLDTLNRQVGSNMVGYSASSALVNIDALPRALAKTNKTDFVKGFAQFASNKIGSIFGRSDGFAEQSPVMIRRKGTDRFYRTPWQKGADAGYIVMGAVDNAATEIIARTKYNEFIKKGMDAQKAHIETDKWVSRLMGDRSLGQMPQIYNSKTLGLITKFQLEVRNNLDSMFYDTIQDAKVSNEHIQNALTKNAMTAAKVTSTLVQLAIGQHLFGKAMESVVGYNPAFDIISTLLTVCGFDDEEDSEDTVLDNIEQGFLELLEDLPYTGTFTGGRIPIASALPIEELITGKDEYGNEKPRLQTLGEIAPYYLMPGGYNQLKKTTQGLGMFDEDLPIAGSYTDSGNLRFPIEDNLKNRVQAGLFGQYANENARDYFDNGRSPLKEKQIQELVDLDLPIRDYWEYREGLKEQETLEDKFEYIAGLDVSVEQKNIMINNVVDRKEKVDMSNYDDFASYEEFDFYSKNEEKYHFLEDNNVSYAEYTSSKEAKENYDSIYSWYKNNPEKVTVSKAVTDNVIEYKRFTSELNDIRADKDANGNSISGSAKDKKIDYINGLNLDYGQKIILFRTYYDSKDDKATYNADIVDYLNSRSDLSYDEIVTILTELDFTVYPDGTVEW